MEKAPIPEPHTVWESCTVTEEQIQALATPRVAEAQDGGRLEADDRRGVPDRGDWRDCRLTRAHRAQIRGPGGRLVPWPPFLLPDRAGTSRSKLNHHHFHHPPL
jgi:hypothetical protein